MPTIRVDDISVPAGAKTFAGYLEVLGPEYTIQITLEEGEWVQPVLEHILVFIESPLGTAVTGSLVAEISRAADGAVYNHAEQEEAHPDHQLELTSEHGRFLRHRHNGTHTLQNAVPSPDGPK